MDGVEDRRGVSSPGRAVVRAWDHFLEINTRAEITESQHVDLVTLEVDRPREPTAIRADLEKALVQVSGSAIVVHLLEVDQQQLRGGSVSDRTSDKLRVVIPLGGQEAIAPAFGLPRRRGLIVGHSCRHLSCQNFAQTCKPRHALVVVVTFGLKISSCCGLVWVGDPCVRVGVLGCRPPATAEPSARGRRCDRRVRHVRTVVHRASSRTGA
ncbi:unannotated protein [freshwater metagenome]|uniref:Unannotated protein n=1 Tax=freshwater metagenome TaxID=449393 RepID=A0A6J7JSE9_9ZZZZ